MSTQESRPDLGVDFAGHHFRNPVTVASGTFGSGLEYSRFVDLNTLGAVTTKGVSDKPWGGKSHTSCHRDSFGHDEGDRASESRSRCIY